MFSVILTFFRKLFGLSPTPAAPADPCSDPACVAAKDRLQTARRGFNDACRGLRLTRTVIDALVRVVNPVTVVGLMVALVALALLTQIPALRPLALILGVLVLGVLVAFLLLPVLGKVAQELAKRLADFRGEVEAGLRDVEALCPPACRGDVSPPECKL